MIRSFASKAAQDIYDGVNSRYARKVQSELHEKIRRLFDQINVAVRIDTLRIPPGNHLEKLSGDLKGLWSIRVNDQWRIIFRWEEGNAMDIDIVDYH